MLDIRPSGFRDGCQIEAIAGGDKFQLDGGETPAFPICRGFLRGCAAAVRSLRRFDAWRLSDVKKIRRHRDFSSNKKASRRCMGYVERQAPLRYAPSIIK